MDVFQVHQQLIADYQAFTAGFTKIHDDRIREHVDRRVANGDQWPDAYLSLNPNFASGGSISELVKQGFLHPECERIFRVGRRNPPDRRARLSICTSISGRQSRSPGVAQAMCDLLQLADLVVGAIFQCADGVAGASGSKLWQAKS